MARRVRFIDQQCLEPSKEINSCALRDSQWQTGLHDLSGVRDDNLNHYGSGYASFVGNAILAQRRAQEAIARARAVQIDLQQRKHEASGVKHFSEISVSGSSVRKENNSDCEQHINQKENILSASISWLSDVFK